MRVLTSNVQKVCLTKMNKLLHQGLVFQCVEHGLENLFKQLKDDLKQCFGTQMQAIKDIMNICPIHLVIKNILVD